MKKLIIKMCAFMILITLFTGCHPQNKLYSFETKKIDDQVILILKNISKEPIDLSLKVNKVFSFLRKMNLKMLIMMK